MTEDKFDPMWTIKSLWNNRAGKFPFNNKGVAGDGDNSNNGSGDSDDDSDDNGSVGVATAPIDWKSTLDPTIKDHPSLKNFKTPGDVAKSYLEAQRLIGKKGVPLPSKDADPLDDTKRKDWDTVYDTLGRPSDPNAYELPKVEYPAGFPKVPEETVKGFKELSHKIGLLPHQVKALYQWQHEQAMNGVNQNTEAQATSLRTSEQELRKEYGKAFDSNLSIAKGLLKKFGSNEVLAGLDSSGFGNNPHFIRFMVKVAKQFGEDGNTLVGETQSAILTPQEAQAEVDKIMADKSGAYWNRANDKGIKPFSDAEHKAVVKKVQDLMSMAHPEQR